MTPEGFHFVDARELEGGMDIAVPQVLAGKTATAVRLENRLVHVFFNQNRDRLHLGYARIVAGAPALEMRAGSTMGNEVPPPPLPPDLSTDKGQLEDVLTRMVAGTTLDRITLTSGGFRFEFTYGTLYLNNQGVQYVGQLPEHRLAPGEPPPD